MRVLAAFLFALLASPVLAQNYSDPKVLIEALYAFYGPDFEFVPDIRPLRSDRLNTLYDKDAAEAEGDIGRIDFDPFINAQYYQIENLEIAEPYLAGGRAVVRVSFDNLGTQNELGFLLVHERGGWRIDNVWNVGGEYGYDLLDILQAPLP